MANDALDNDEYPTFAEWLTANRRRARYSIRELALEAGVSHTYVSRLEQAKKPASELKPRPSHDVVTGIARVLDADLRTGLKLAGWLPEDDGDSADRFTDDERRWIARYRALTPQRQKLIDQILRELDKPDADVQSTSESTPEDASS